MRAIVCEPMKEARVEEIGTELEDLQAIVEGYIEAFYPFEDEACIVCNDEGKFNGSLPCRAVYDSDGETILDIVFGTFFICGLGEEDFCSLTDEQVSKYLEQFKSPEVFYRTADGKIVARKYHEENNI